MGKGREKENLTARAFSSYPCPNITSPWWEDIFSICKERLPTQAEVRRESLQYWSQKSF